VSYTVGIKSLMPMVTFSEKTTVFHAHLRFDLQGQKKTVLYVIYEKDDLEGRHLGLDIPDFFKANFPNTEGCVPLLLLNES